MIGHKEYCTCSQCAAPRTVPFDPGEGGDHDTYYTFGRRPSSTNPMPFSVRQYARLLVLRGKIQDYGLAEADRAVESVRA